MEQDNRANITSGIKSLGGKSWTAYVGTVFTFFVLLYITLIAWHESDVAGVVALAVSLAFVVYRFLYLKSYHLYFDDVGIWVYSGVLPWNKGVYGVKWRDLDEAVYSQSIASWIFKSYSIRIGHRFTKSSEVRLSHWARGHEAVMTINGQHEEMVRAGTLS